MTGSMIVECEYDEKDSMPLTNIEKQAYHWLSEKLPDIRITHLEVEPRPLKEAFGVGL